MYSNVPYFRSGQAESVQLAFLIILLWLLRRVNANRNCMFIEQDLEQVFVQT